MKRFQNEDDSAEWADQQNDIMYSEPEYKSVSERYPIQDKPLKEIKEPSWLDIAFAWVVFQIFRCLSWILCIPYLWILLVFSLLLLTVIIFAQIWRFIYAR